MIILLINCTIISGFYCHDRGKKRHHRQEIKNTLESLSVFLFWLTGLLLNAGGGGLNFPWLLQTWPPATFIEKQKRNRTKEIPSCLIPAYLLYLPGTLNSWWHCPGLKFLSETLIFTSLTLLTQWTMLYYSPSLFIENCKIHFIINQLRQCMYMLM